VKTILRTLARVLANAGPRALGVLLIACGLAIPAYAYWHSTRPPYYGLAAQASVPLPREPRSLLAMSDYQDGVVVLCYHDLSHRAHNRYTVTPDAFAAQMAVLRASGFHTISAAEFAAFLRGSRVSLPSRPLFITFDDGAKGTWIYADRILRRLSYQATVFLITGDVSHHQPYYLDWPEVEAMARSKRWSFGAHTYQGHGLIATDNSGDTGPFLTNRMWLPAKNRVETLDEYQARVSHDLDRSIFDIRAHGLPYPDLFAYPFSATVEPTNDPVIIPVLKRMLAERFSGLMDNTSSATLIHPGMSAPLPRVEVFHGMGAEELVVRVKDTIARSPITGSPTHRPTRHPTHRPIVRRRTPAAKRGK
jgi:poly-beta-1,6-N-acetyl-D-glucosamine N-deacetylase